MIRNYEEALGHMYNTDMLNDKGLKDYIKILRSKVTELSIKLQDFQNKRR